MSSHMSWTDVYDAVKCGDVEVLDMALFILDTSVFTCTLDGSKTALQLAAQYGHVDLVASLLNSHLLRVLDKSYVLTLITSTFLEGCKLGSLAIVNHCLESESRLQVGTITEESRRTGIVLAARAGAVTVVRHQLFNNDPGLRSEEFIERIVKVAYEEGHELAPFAAMEEFETVINRLKGESSIFELQSVNFDVTVLKKRDFLCRTVYEQAAIQNRGDVLMMLMTEPRHDLMEDACDAACKYGRTDIYRLMVEQDWVNDVITSERWRQRLTSAVESDHTKMFILLLERYKTLQTMNRFLSKWIRKKSVREESVTELKSFIANLLKVAVGNNNPVIVSEMVLLGLHSDDVSDAYDWSIRFGFPDVVRVFHGHGAKAKICERFPKRKYPGRKRKIADSDCFHVSLVVANVVISELLLGKACKCWSRLIKTPTPCRSYTREWRYAVQSEFVTNRTEIMKLILLKASRLKRYKQYYQNKHSRLILWYLFNHPALSYAERMIGLIDFTDAHCEYFRTLSHYDNLSLYDVCYFLRSLCGAQHNELGVTFEATSHDHPLFCRCILETGIRMIDIRCTRCLQETGKRDIRCRHPNAPAENTGRNQTNSLKNLCRIAIRRVIRCNHPRDYLPDMILTLYFTGVIPRQVVNFLLFRDNRLPVYLRNVPFITAN